MPTSSASSTETRPDPVIDAANTDAPQEPAEPADRPRGFAHVARVTSGAILLPVGIALLVLPGPGLPLIAASLALLRTEFRWADKAWHKLSAVAQRGLAHLRPGTRLREPRTRA